MSIAPTMTPDMDSVADAAGSAPAAEPRATPERSTLSRRGLLAGFGVLAGLGGRRAFAAPPDTPADVDPTSLLTKLANRCTMGANAEELGLVTSLGYDAYLERHLDPLAIDDSAMGPILAPYPSLTMTYEQMLGVTSSSVAQECADSSLLRAIYSKRQLFERMVEFWSDHFNIEMNGDPLQRMRPIDDRDVIRPHALGGFPAMLAASAHSPAMLNYLNNNVNNRTNPNENYARELMELHTIGVDGGYTHQDIAEIARCFTGWTYYNDASGALAGTFRYNSANHDVNQKVVLGNIIPARSAAAGIQDGADVLNILAAHPSTAQFLAKKLCRWLLGYDVTPGVVAKVAAAYTQTGGDIKAMIRACLRPDHLAAATLKYKRPWHLFASALRLAPINITSLATVRSRIFAAGHARFRWATPDGYPDTLQYWVGFIISHWNLGAELLQGQMGITVDTTALFAGATTPDQAVARINALTMGGEMPAFEVERLRAFIAAAPANPDPKREALGLAIGYPSFQWH